jgi:photosystem II stability/assembly factor-like uncharacterized protein
MRFTALAGVALTAAVATAAAACGTASPAAGGAASPASPSAGTSSAAAGTPAALASTGAASAGAGPASPPSPAASCAGSPAASSPAGTLTGLQFTSAATGWAVGRNVILSTTDGGAHWQPQLTGSLNLTSVDFISGQDGWAAGPGTLLATTDGGTRWTRLPEPCPVIRAVHFISPTTGFAVAGASGSGSGSGLPVLGGTVLATSDGGHSWHSLAAPANAQSVCFSDPQHGWLGADGVLYRTSDGGHVWASLTSLAGQAGSAGPDDPALMSVECASGGSAWALQTGPGAAMSQEPHVGYHADQAGATAVFAEQYFQNQGAAPVAPAPGSYAGPFSALSPTAAVFVDWCTACGLGTAPWDVATASGAVLTKKGNVGDITSPEAASFLSPQAGWVAGAAMEQNAAGQSRTQQRIVATAGGGRSWQVQYAGPWSAWTG